MKFPFLILLFFMVTIRIGATNYTAVASGSWNNTAIWTPMGIPGIGDNVTVPMGTSVTLVNSVTVDILNVSGGSIYGNFKLDVNSYFNWTSGAIYGTDTLNVFQNGLIAGGVLNNKTLVCHGTIERSGNDFSLNTGSQFIINTDVLLTSNFTSDKTLFYLGTSTTLINHGTFQINNSNITKIIGTTEYSNFYNYGAIDIVSGDLLFQGLRSTFISDTISVCPSCTLSLNGYYNGYGNVLTNYIFKSSTIIGDGLLKTAYPGATWYFKDNTQINTGIQFSEGVIYDSVGVNLKYLYMTGTSQFKGNGNTTIQDSLYWAGGTIGENGGTNTMTVLGNAQINGGILQSITMVFKDKVWRNSGTTSIDKTATLRIDTSAVLTTSLPNNQPLFNSSSGINKIENFGTIIKNNSGINTLNNSSSSSVSIFKNYGKIIINEGELAIIGLNATFENDTISICPSCTLSLSGYYNGYGNVLTNYIFKSTTVLGSGLLKTTYPGANWYFKDNTQIHAGIKLDQGIIYDSVSVNLKYLYLSGNGQFRGSGNTTIQDSLYWTGGTIGENGNTSTMTVLGNAQLISGTLQSKTMIFKNKLWRNSGNGISITGSGNLRIDTTAILTINLPDNQSIFSSYNGINKIENYGSIIKNNSGINTINNSSSGSGFLFKNYGKIIINEGELAFSGLNATFENDSISICPACTISMKSYNSGYGNILTNYIFKSSTVLGNGLLKTGYPGANWYFKDNTQVHAGIKLDQGIIYDSVGVNLKYMYMTGGQLSGSGNTTIQDSLYWAGGAIGENGNTSTMTVFGNAQINSGTLQSKTMVMKNKIWRSIGALYLDKNATFKIDTSAVLTTNLPIDQNIFSSYTGINKVENYGSIIKNNNVKNSITYNSSGTLQFNNYNKIVINEGELSMIGINASFYKDTVILCATCILSLTGKVSLPTDYIFKNSTILGNGLLKSAYPAANWYFKQNTQVHAGIQLDQGIIYDSVGVNLTYLYLSGNGQFRGSGNTTIQDSLFWAGGTIGENGNTSTMTVFGNAQINSGTLQSKTMVMKNKIWRNIGALYLDKNATFKIDTLAVQTTNLPNNQNIFSSYTGINKVENYGSIIKNNNVKNSITYNSSSTLQFNNYNKIVINEGELSMIGINASFYNDTVILCATCILSLTGKVSLPTNYIFKSSTILGGGTIKAAYPSSNMYFKDDTHINAGVQLSEGIIYDSVGVNLKYMYMTGGQFRGSGNTSIQDSLFWAGGTIGENGNTSAMTVLGNAQINSGILQSKTMIFKNKIWRNSASLSIYYNGIFRIDTTAILYSNFTTNQTLFTSNNTSGTIENYGTINKLDNLSILLSNYNAYENLKFFNHGTLNIEGGELYCIDIKFIPSKGIINLNNKSKLRISSTNNYVPLNIIFNDGSVNGTGRLILEGNSKCYFKNSIAFDAGIELNSYSAEIIDSVGIQPKFVVLKYGTIKPVASMVIQDSLITTGGNIGHTSYNGTVYVNGFSQLKNVSINHITLSVNDTVTLTNVYIDPLAHLILDTLSRCTINHCLSDVLHITGPNTGTTFGRITVYGTLIKKGCGKSTIRQAIFEFRGILQVEEGALELNIPNDPTGKQGFEAGEITISANAKFCVYTFQSITVFSCAAYSIFQNIGEICFGSNVTFNIINPGPISGLYSGKGTITSPNIINQGVINPGFSPGIMKFNNLTNSNIGQVNIEIGAASGPGTNYDQIVVNGPLTLNGGILKIELINGYTPTLGTSFTIFTQQQLAGTFATLITPNTDPNKGWKVVYNNTSIVLIYSARYWKDYDNDGFGSLVQDTLIQTAITPTGFVINSTDCDDFDSYIYPNSTFTKTYANGNWNDNSVWLCGNPSASIDSILISHTIDIDNSLINLNANVIMNNAQLNLLNTSNLSIGSLSHFHSLGLVNSSIINADATSSMHVFGILNNTDSSQINNEGLIHIHNP